MLLRGQEGVYLCLFSLQKKFEDDDQWTPKKGVWQICGFWRESSQIEVVPTIKKCNERCVSYEGWKHFGL